MKTRNTCVPTPVDIMYAAHEGTYRVLAIWPAPSGKLTNMVDWWSDTTNTDCDLKPWVFMEVPMTQDAAGYRYPDHHIRGVRSGSFADGEDFISLCRQLGLVAKPCNWHVPFANGKGRHGDSYDFDTGDLRYLRSDEPPTKEQLEVELSKSPRSPRS